MAQDHEHFDVVVVGAGISGIGAAYHLQRECPNKSFVVLEGRDDLGGTWDLFRYPGIRSDSDMYTLGFSFRPWTDPKAIADGPAILDYLRETARVYGIDQKIRFQHQVERAAWSTEDARWTLDVRVGGELRQITCAFLHTCAGYYDYDEGYTPALEGRERFRGRIVHPQKWTPDVEWTGKRVIVIGSGATAVTLVPELAKKAAHVTMLQRSPTYIMAVPGKDPIADWLRERIPREPAYAITRWKNVFVSMAFFNACRAFPALAKRFLVGEAKKAVAGGADVDPHFVPRYDPWDQRVCIVPDGDLFTAVREGRASVVTDAIDTFTETGLRLRSGAELPADLVVTATGLNLKFIGGIAIYVDERRVEPAKTLMYKGLMLSGVPNLALAVGYTNASWTLKADLTSEYVCRLLKHMDRKGYTWCCPERPAGEVGEVPIIDFTSSYVKRAIADLPRQGTEPPWRLFQNYAVDVLWLRHAPVADRAMRFGGGQRRSRARSSAFRSTPHR